MVCIEIIIFYILIIFSLYVDTRLLNVNAIFLSKTQLKKNVSKVLNLYLKTE